jgi:hypothetical protein
LIWVNGPLFEMDQCDACHDLTKSRGTCGLPNNGPDSDHGSLRGVEVRLHGVRQDSPPKMISIDYEIIVDTDEDDRRLELLHTNIRKFGTIYNTVAAASKLSGRVLRRRMRDGSGKVGFDGQS